MRSALWLFGGLLAAFLVVQSGFDATEAETSIELSRALRKGELSSEKQPFGPWFRASNGRWYSAHDLLAPALATPAIALGDLGPVPRGVPRDRWTHALQAAMGALVAAGLGLALFLTMSRRLEIPPRRALAATMLAVFASTVLPYARTNYDGELSAMLLVFALFVGLAGTRRAAFGAGLLLGAACLARASSVVALPFVALAIALDARLVLVALGALPSGIALLFLNAARTGHALVSPVALPGFRGNNGLTGSFFAGFFGNLVSPGKGLLFHAPIVVAAIAGLVLARRRRVMLASFGALLALALVHAKVRNWSGHWAWGPRYLLPAVPLLLLGLGDALATRKRRIATAALAIPSAFVALLPVLVFWTARIAAAGVGNQDLAFTFGANQIGDATWTLVQWLAGRCPPMSSVAGASCTPDLFWLTWPKAYGIEWPRVVAVLLFVAAVAMLAMAFRSARPAVAREAAEGGHVAM